ncbi:hypothetical protein ACLUWX_08275, partial [Bifidobacterium apri]|uniref:hypothetical protein n=1 Tax=Bifidobacterium apri TaxID=1769423 RepID=UPI0039969B3C
PRAPPHPSAFPMLLPGCFFESEHMDALAGFGILVISALLLILRGFSWRHAEEHSEATGEKRAGFWRWTCAYDAVLRIDDKPVPMRVWDRQDG